MTKKVARQMLSVSERGGRNSAPEVGLYIAQVAAAAVDLLVTIK
jgi:hypothetical protein